MRFPLIFLFLTFLTGCNSQSKPAYNNIQQTKSLEINTETIKRLAGNGNIVMSGIVIDSVGRLCFGKRFIKMIKDSDGKEISAELALEFKKKLFEVVLDYQRTHPGYKYSDRCIKITKKDSGSTQWDGPSMRARFVNIDQDTDKEMLFSFQLYGWHTSCFLVAKRIKGVYRCIFIDSMGSRLRDSIIILFPTGSDCVFGIMSSMGAGPTEWDDYNLYKMGNKQQIKNVFYLSSCCLGTGPVTFEKSMRIDPLLSKDNEKSISVHYFIKAQLCHEMADPKRASPYKRNAFDDFEDQNCEDNESFNLLNDTFLIRFVYDAKTETYNPDYAKSEVDPLQFAALTNSDVENLSTKKNLKKLFRAFAYRIQENASGNPKDRVALKWMREYLGLER